MAWPIILIFVLIAAGLLALWAYRRAPKAASAEPGKHHARIQAGQWGVRIAAPARDRACPKARGLMGKEFPIDRKPPLPLPDCPFPNQCACHYVKLFDRRRDERRSDEERRQSERVEGGGPPRRTGKDRRRRRKNIDWA